MDREEADRIVAAITREQPSRSAQLAKRSARFRARFDRLHTGLVTLLSFGAAWRLLQPIVHSQYAALAISALIGLAVALVFPSRRQA